MRRLLLLTLISVATLCTAQGAGARVLRVGTWHGIKGQYNSIEAAVKASKPNDWILVAPGDWKTHSSGEFPSNSHHQFPAAILLTKPGVYLRGMNRNKVIVDGTKSGPPCNHIKADQNFGPPPRAAPLASTGSWSGRPTTSGSRT